MHVGWTAPRPITDAMTTLAGTVSSLVTLALARIVATKAIQQVEFRGALEAMLDDVAIGRAVRSDDGAIVDFVIEFVNSHSANDAEVVADDLVGRLVRDIYPEWLTSGMFARLCDVVETGVPYRGDRLRWAGTGRDGAVQQGYRSMQVAKFGDGYIAASRDDTEMVAAEEASREAALQEAAERTAIVLLQAAALPTTLPQLPGVRIAAVYEPADPRQPVGGDWYDVFALDDERVAVVIADVAGHGHPAAVFMVQVRNVFRAIAAEHTEPGDVLNRANDVTTRLNELDGPFVTCCYAVLDIGARTLRWAQAGHFSPLVVAADGTSTYLAERPGPPLALFEGHRYESSSIEVRSGRSRRDVHRWSGGAAARTPRHRAGTARPTLHVACRIGSTGVRRDPGEPGHRPLRRPRRGLHRLRRGVAPLTWVVGSWPATRRSTGVPLAPPVAASSPSSSSASDMP